ncbi:MAG: ATP-binding protein [Myxococcota bacterium]
MTEKIENNQKILRDIIEIDEDLCDGCGLCIPECAEGALQLIDGKARLLSDIFCDGLGACVGHCPRGAMVVTKKETEPYDEKKVMLEKIIPAGGNIIKAHLQHLENHQADDLVKIARATLKTEGIELKEKADEEKIDIEKILACGCPGAEMRSLADDNDGTNKPDSKQGDLSSKLGHWPVQLSLLSPWAPYLKNSDLVIIADCVAFAYGDTHNEFIEGNTVAIGCPKLDKVEPYLEKLAAIIRNNKLNSIKVVIMEVPCCRGMVQIVKEAIIRAREVIPFQVTIISTEGKKL